jgi:hypothetical protein
LPRIGARRALVLLASFHRTGFYEPCRKIAAAALIVF